ncbi:MAG TPA: hypothetical protein PK431_07255 [Chitinophagales bacterium]|nr:hypothetical protein [Chitinophagales bacterium]
MKSIFLILSTIFCLNSYSQEIPNYDEFTFVKDGYIIKNNGDSIFGKINILEEDESLYYQEENKNAIINQQTGHIDLTATIVDSMGKIFKIPFFDINTILYGDIKYEIRTVNKNRNIYTLVSQIKSDGKLKIFYGFEFTKTKSFYSTISPPFSQYGPVSAYFKIKEIYMISSEDDKQMQFSNLIMHSYLYFSSKFSKGSPELETVVKDIYYKKQLKKLFPENEAIKKYISTLKNNMKFEELPNVFSEINKMF